MSDPIHPCGHVVAHFGGYCSYPGCFYNQSFVRTLSYQFYPGETDPRVLSIVDGELVEHFDLPRSFYRHLRLCRAIHSPSFTHLLS